MIMILLYFKHLQKMNVVSITLECLKLLLLTIVRLEHSWASTQELGAQNPKSWKFKDCKLQHKDDVHKIKTNETKNNAICS
jgi:hypothetical protein